MNKFIPGSKKLPSKVSFDRSDLVGISCEELVLTRTCTTVQQLDTTKGVQLEVGSRIATDRNME